MPVSEVALLVMASSVKMDQPVQYDDTGNLYWLHFFGLSQIGMNLIDKFVQKLKFSHVGSSLPFQF